MLRSWVLHRECWERQRIWSNFSGRNNRADIQRLSCDNSILVSSSIITFFFPKSIYLAFASEIILKKIYNQKTVTIHRVGCHPNVVIQPIAPHHDLKISATRAGLIYNLWNAQQTKCNLTLGFSLYTASRVHVTIESFLNVSTISSIEFLQKDVGNSDQTKFSCLDNNGKSEGSFGTTPQQDFVIRVPKNVKGANYTATGSKYVSYEI